MRGIERNIPITPQIYPQNVRERSITRGDRLSLFPRNFGSSTFHIVNWSDERSTHRAITTPHSPSAPNWIILKHRGIIAARAEPIVGI